MHTCDLCSDAVITTDIDTGVANAAALVRECGVPIVVAVDQDVLASRPVGTVTATEVARAASRLSQYGASIGDVMNRRIVTCRWDDSVEHALNLMRASADHIVLVLNDQGGFCGFLAPGQVREYLASIIGQVPKDEAKAVAPIEA